MNAEYSMYAGGVAHQSPSLPVPSGSTTFSSYRGSSESAPFLGEEATRTNGNVMAIEALTTTHTESSRDGSDSEDPTTPASEVAQQQQDIGNKATDATKQEELKSQRQSALNSDVGARLLSHHFDERTADVGRSLGSNTPLIPELLPLESLSNITQDPPILSPAPSQSVRPTSPASGKDVSFSMGPEASSSRSSPLSDISDGDRVLQNDDAGPSASPPAQQKKAAKRAAPVKKAPTKAKKQKVDTISPSATNKRRKSVGRASMPHSEKDVDQSSGEPGPSNSTAHSSHGDVTALFALQQNIPQDLDEADRAAMEAAMAEDLRSGSRPRRAALNKPRASYLELQREIGDDANQGNRPKNETKAKVKGKSRPSAAVSEATRFQMSDRWYEYQVGDCQRGRWSRWYKCTHCTARQMGDTCRFVNLRIFPLRSLDGKLIVADPEDDDALEYAPFFGNELPRKVTFDYPRAKSLFPPASAASISDIKSTVAISLHQTMKMELDHAARPETLWRNPELVIRPQCDFCLTSLFSASYCCRCCGKEYCLECTEALKAKEATPGKWNQVASVEKCRLQRVHTFSELWPLTRFRVEELQDEVREMERVQQGGLASDFKRSETESRLPEHSVQLEEPQENADSAVPSGSVPLEERTRQWYKSLDGPTVDAAIGSHRLQEFHAGHDETAFRKLWARGEPVIVHDCIRDFQEGEEDERGEVVGSASAAPPAEWGPQSFCTSRWQEEPCRITRCDADNAHQDVYVSDFFSTFGKSPEEKLAKLGKGVWKLKDWPPSSAFDDAFPDLYKHFNKALPVPAFTRRDGRMNISALFPTNANAPDLGPKMYNAWPSTEDQVGMGSTRLHMDIADAVNIMYYAAKPLNAEELPLAHRDGVAAWDIFPAGDSNKIRDYLRETRKVEEHEDPIHSQKYFLDAGDRQKLWDTKGVRSWRIYQKAHDAILIPAGCAHQVCNLTDCMKIAVDFVSPENVARCFRLTAEFRALSNNKVRSWKEDVLQLKSMLWHAWRACREMEGHKYDAEGSVQVESGQVRPPARYSKPFTDLASIHKAAKRKKKAKRGAVDVELDDEEDESMLDVEVDEGDVQESKVSTSAAKAKQLPKAKAKGKVSTKRSAASAFADGTLDEEDEEASSPPLTSRRTSTRNPAPTYSRKGKKSEAAYAGSAIVIADDDDDDDESSQGASSPPPISTASGRPKRQAAAAGTKRLSGLFGQAEATEVDEEGGEEEEDEEYELATLTGRRKKASPLGQAKSKGKGKEKGASKARSASTRIPRVSSSPSPAAASTLATATASGSVPPLPLPPLPTLPPNISRPTPEHLTQLTAAFLASEETMRVAREQVDKWFGAMQMHVEGLRRCAEGMRGMLEGQGEGEGEEKMKVADEEEEDEEVEEEEEEEEIVQEGL